MSQEHDDVSAGDESFQRVVGVLRCEPHVPPGAVESVMRHIRAATPAAEQAQDRSTRHAAIGLVAAAAVVLVALTAKWNARAGQQPDDTRPVQFVFVASHASGVSVLGTFNDWDVGAHPLTRSGPAGLWVTELSLRPGRYEYAYAVDGEWMNDREASKAGLSEYGEANSVIVVEAGDAADPDDVTEGVDS